MPAFPITLPDLPYYSPAAIATLPDSARVRRLLSLQQLYPHNLPTTFPTTISRYPLKVLEHIHQLLALHIWYADGASYGFELQYLLADTNKYYRPVKEAYVRPSSGRLAEAWGALGEEMEFVRCMVKAGDGNKDAVVKAIAEEGGRLRGLVVEKIKGVVVDEAVFGVR